MVMRTGNKGNIYLLMVGVKTCRVTMEIYMVVSQRIRKSATSKSIYITLGHVPKRCFLLHKDTYSTVLIVAVFIIEKKWKQLSCTTPKERTVVPTHPPKTNSPDRNPLKMTQQL